MNTSPTLSLSNPVDDEEVPLGTLAYMRARYRGRMHEVVLEEFRKSGITQATLARRLGVAPEIISRRLGAPGNWRMDTVSDLLFGISGAEPVKDVRYALSEAARNDNFPDWFKESSTMKYLEREILPESQRPQSLGIESFFTLTKMLGDQSTKQPS